MSRTALITGISGQDGSYLTELLHEKGYRVHGTVACKAPGIGETPPHLHYCDLGDGGNLDTILDEVQPDEVYNLAAQSHVRLSFDLPVYTADVTGVGTLRVLEAIRKHQRRHNRNVRFYQAASSEMFGEVSESPQRETTPFHPRSPYSCAKVFAFWQTVNYRESYDMFATNGILFNHESPRRGEAFVTRKITIAAARIKLGLQKSLKLGNLEARRDWGFAGDYVEAMWLMLQHDEPLDLVIGTGETHSVREFLEEVFAYHDLDYHDFVEFDAALQRPAEVSLLCADASKAHKVLGWEPKVSFTQLAHMMAEADLEAQQVHGG
ncbi:MAG: GDP-mannose 4,6-dehydratase [Planctomycetaceae bacterium]|nr:GDP-mannose 4,6-dehydratase [Planctomycetaceae bacterium]